MQQKKIKRTDYKLTDESNRTKLNLSFDPQVKHVTLMRSQIGAASGSYLDAPKAKRIARASRIRLILSFREKREKERDKENNQILPINL